MKKTVLLLTLIIAFYAQTAGQIHLSQPVPMDTAIRYGRLDNGLTYYIRANQEPKGYADFQIFHAVGALQEKADQNGLAHFLEHLAFKELGHFPGNSMMDYMERIGVKFGANLNAATSQAYTRYMIRNVPMTREGIIDTCLLTLFDWSGAIACTQQDIDTERGVIEEEQRSHGDVNFRIHKAITPYVFKDSKYAERNVIGDMNVVRSFKREALLDFYHRWYRPDVQAIAIVGDFDINEMEAKVKKLFHQLPKPEQPTVREHYGLPDNKELIYGTYSDKEAMGSSFTIMMKHPSTPREKRVEAATYVHNYVRSLTIGMMNQRMRDLLREGHETVKDMGYAYESLADDRDAFILSVDAKTGGENIQPALDFLLQESERFRRFGFTDEELSIAKAKAERQLESMYIDRDKRTHGRHVEACFNHFIENTPLPGMPFSYQLLKQALASLTLEQVNSIAKQVFTNENRVITAVTPAAEASFVPDKQSMEKALAAMPSLSVTPYVSEERATSLLERKPAAGKVVSEKKTGLDATEWLLSNGAKVYLLPTECRKDEIMMYATREGGFSLISDEDFNSSRMMIATLMASGVDQFDATALEQMLAGKTVYVYPLLGEFSEMIDCSTTPTDLEAMLQLTYLYFTSPRFDAKAFKVQQEQLKENLTARRSNPFSTLQDSVFAIRSNYHPRSERIIVDPDDVDRVDLGVIERLYKERFGNPAGFDFYFVGNFETEKIKPLVEQYIGALPGTPAESNWKDLGIRPPEGRIVSDFKRTMENPKSITFMEYTMEQPQYSKRLSTVMRMLQGVLEVVYNQVIRIERSGTYNVDVEASLTRFPVPKTNVIVSFQTKPELMDELQQTALQTLRDLAQHGIDEETLQKSREYMLKLNTQQKDMNMYWRLALYNFITFGEDPSDNVEIINSITAEELQQELRKILAANNIVEVTMRPE